MGQVRLQAKFPADGYKEVIVHVNSPSGEAIEVGCATKVASSTSPAESEQHIHIALQLALVGYTFVFTAFKSGGEPTGDWQVISRPIEEKDVLVSWLKFEPEYAQIPVTSMLPFRSNY